MGDVFDDKSLLSIIKYHLEKVLEYNPYYSFDGIENKEDFKNLIAADPAFKYLGLSDDRYVLSRFGGNLITSLHRKIGDMYEEIFKYLIKTSSSTPLSETIHRSMIFWTGWTKSHGQRWQRRSSWCTLFPRKRNS